MSHLKIYLVTFACLFISAFATAQDPTVYTFDGAVSNIWRNPDNWTPAYPGTTTNEGESIVIIDALCHASGMSLDIGGALVIKQGEVLNLKSTNLIVGGTLTIRGELNIHPNGNFTNNGYTTLESNGVITNNETVVNNSTLIIEGVVVNHGQWINTAFSEMQVLSMATFVNYNTLVNNGIIEDFSSGFINNLDFENHGEFDISGAFVNAGNLTNLSTIFINGTLTTIAGSNLFNHRLLDISISAELINSGTTYNFSAAQMSNDGSIVNSENGTILNQGTISTKGGMNFMLKPGSYLENRPGSVVTVN